MMRSVSSLYAMAVLLCAGSLAAQTGIEGAYRLLSEGRVADGRVALLEASAALAPSAAVPHLKLARVLGRIAEAQRPGLGRMAALAHQGQAKEAVEGLAGLAAEASPEDAPALLALAAGYAAAGGDLAAAEALWVQVIRDYPTAQEWVAAVLEVGEARARSGGNVTEVVGWIEVLIVDNPQGALVPQARLLLERLRAPQ